MPNIDYTVKLTDYGRAKLALAETSGIPVEITHMAVGDSGVVPTAAAVALGHEVFRALITDSSVAANDPGLMQFELVVPNSVGGFWMREVGVFDADGGLMYVAAMPQEYKPAVPEVVGKECRVTVLCAVGNAVNVQLIIDPSVLLATRDYVDRVRADLASPGGSSLLFFLQSGEGANPRSTESKLRDLYVSPFDIDDELTDQSDIALATNIAASICRVSGRGLYIPPTATYFTASDTLDLSDIRHIDARAEIRSTFSGKPAAIIGGTATTFSGADIYLKVRNAADQSNVLGTNGIKFLNFSYSHLTLYARGFLSGLHFDGASANRVWVDNKIDVLDLANNKSPVHFDMGGTSYAVKQTFSGGRYYIGQIAPDPNSGTFKLSLAGSALVSDITVESPEIGIDRSGIDLTTFGVLVFADVNTTWDINTIQFRDVRFEGYGTWGNDNPYAVNIATNTSGRLGVDVEFSGSVPSDVNYSILQVFHPVSRSNKIRLANTAVRPQGTTAYPQTVIPNEVVPYQTVTRCYVPGRVIYDQATGYAVPADYFQTSFGSNSISRANGDGDLISGSTTDSFGLIYAKTPSQVSFLELLTPQQFAVVCFDVNGNILSGSAPYYAVGENGRSVTRGSVTIYEFSGRWLWLHKDVASFYIGAARWASNGKLQDIAFNVTFGSLVAKVNNTKMSARNNVANVLPAQAFMPVGAAMDGTNTNGWRNTFSLRTTASAGVAAGAADITLASVTGIAAGDSIGIELDTEIATGLRRYHYTTVSAVAGATVTLGAALPANVAAGRAVLVNRWVAR